jgi:hypothetical protein
VRVTLDELLDDELELRDLLLREASADDADAVAIREICGRWHGWVDRWPIGAALDELRLVERRIYQIREEARR